MGRSPNPISGSFGTCFCSPIAHAAGKQQELWRLLRLELFMSVCICAQLNFQESKANPNKRGWAALGYCRAKGLQTWGRLP